MNRINYSAKREAIYKILRSTDTHPDADWVYNEVKKEFPNISLGTVYRNIVMLKNEGKLKSLGVVKGCERFEANLHPHAHFLCNRCGRIIDVGKSFAVHIDHLNELVEKELSAVVEGHDLAFFGVCDLCINDSEE